eukprot:gene33982-biopygen36287
MGGRIFGKGGHALGKGGRALGKGGRALGKGGRALGKGGRALGKGGRALGKGGRALGKGGRALSRLTELAVKMQKKALLDTTMSNYGPKARRFILFCEQHPRPWLPATEATVLLYIAFVLKDGGIKSAPLQPYLSAINNYHKDLRFPGPAKGRVVTRVVKGMATIQAELAVREENIETQRTWLPAGHVRREHEAALKLTPRSFEELRPLRAFSYVVIAFVTFGRPNAGTSLSRRHVHCGDGEFSVVLLKEKGRRHHLVKRRLCIPWRGVALLKELIGHWEFHPDTT